ncbi:ABC transporter permease [Nesterenkonia lutea]|uniref:Multidrug/hemolysin transport system permease protein n=1 Tax=Nesterenkonia lutea TaxID=272919 RepID=A0ABR9JC44_9MICC|nr:ABC transporter permease [Nesterenkonia lutea]MBE1523508.1 multidrug/hemolysin transport system permease protein [Nesterenkonia lutea]
MIYHLTRRNLLIFFRDPAAIFFSLVAAIILFVLYMAFLSTMQVEALGTNVPQAEPESIDAFVNSWVLGNIAMITTMTTSLSALAVFVEDRATDRFRDFLVTPLSRFDVIAGYLLGAFIISASLSTVVLVLSQLYMWIGDGVVLSPADMARSLGYVIGFCLLFSAIWSFVVTFIRSHPVFMSVGTIVGTAGGFLAAAYVTVSTLPGAVVTFINVLPINQAATLMRVPYTRETVNTLTDGDPQGVETIYAAYGMVPHIGDVEVSEGIIWLVFLVLFVGFLLLGTSRIGRRLG